MLITEQNLLGYLSSRYEYLEGVGKEIIRARLLSPKLTYMCVCHVNVQLSEPIISPKKKRRKNREKIPIIISKPLN